MYSSFPISHTGTNGSAECAFYETSVVQLQGRKIISKIHFCKAFNYVFILSFNMSAKLTWSE